MQTQIKTHKMQVLSEYESKQFISKHGIPIPKEMIVPDRNHIAKIKHYFEFPVVMKGLKPELTHKSEHNLVRTHIHDDQEALATYDELLESMQDKNAGVLISEMLPAQREVMIGLIRDEQFGPCVMFGLGGIFTEILNDVTFRIAPFNKREAMEMFTEIRGNLLLDKIRGLPQVNKDLLADMLVNLGNLGWENGSIHSIDINPVLFDGSKPIAADALVEFYAQDSI